MGTPWNLQDSYIFLNISTIEQDFSGFSLLTSLGSWSNLIKGVTDSCLIIMREIFVQVKACKKEDVHHTFYFDRDTTSTKVKV